jgi:TRAP-type C4-dicarboxylate transport system permease small subunit
VSKVVSVIRRTIGIGTGVSSVFLALLMLLIVAVVIVRPFNVVITGSYELIQLLAVVVIAFALAFTALKQSHIAVSILVSRFSERTQAIVDSINWLLGLGIWGFIFWAGTDIMLQKWLLEKSDLLEVPFLPFRIVWVFGLLLFTLVYLIDMIKALKKAVRP